VPSGRVSACIHTVENNHGSGPKAPFEFEKKNASHSRAKHLLSEGSNLSARLPVRRFNSPNAARATEISASRAQADETIILGVFSALTLYASSRWAYMM
jgi:hypothetical protein